jgi:aspartate aminotransferase
MEISLSRRLSKIAPSPTLALTAKVKALKAKGEDIVGFAAGEPDFDTPEPIKEACIQALREGFTKYTATGGIPELKEAVCNWIMEKRGLKYSPSQALVCCGAKHALYNLFQALLEEGDEVLIPAPYWVTYKDQVAIAGGVPVIVPTDIASGFVPDPEALKEACSPKTRAIVLNSPSNPSGVALSRRQLEAIAGVVVEKNLLVVSDEIYAEIVYDGFRQESIASLGLELYERTFVVDGVSKTFAMTGFRIGYIMGDPKVIKAMNMIQDQSTSNPTSIAQKAALKALTLKEDVVSPMVRKFHDRRDLMLAGMKRIEGVRCFKPAGAFYLFPDMRFLLGKKTPKGVSLETSAVLAEALLEEAKLAAVPGEAFGMPGFLRFSYATGEEEIQKGMDRLYEFCSSLRM